MLGGQHMCAIVKELWLGLTSPNEQGGQVVAESDVPREMRFIFGVILREDTPLEICRLAPGVHQRAQREFCETTFSEVAVAFLQRCAEIVKRTGQKYATPDAAEIREVVRDIGVPYKEYMDIDTTVCDKPICTSRAVFPLSFTVNSETISVLLLTVPRLSMSGGAVLWDDTGCWRQVHPGCCGV